MARRFTGGRLCAAAVFCAAFAALAPLPALATGVDTTPAGSAFAGASAGYADFWGMPWPGTAFDNGLSNSAVNSNYQASATTAHATASNSGVVNTHTFNNSATASAAVGSLHLYATNTSSQSVTFPGAAGNAGWNDQLTITGGTGNGIFVIPFHVSGQMDAVGLGALGLMEVAVYKNGSVFGDSGPAYSYFLANNTTHNGPIYSSWGGEAVEFKVDDYGSSDPDTLQHMTVDETIYFAVPFTYGTSFTLGLWASVEAGELSYSGNTVLNTTTLDFSHTFTLGKGFVLDANGNPVATDFSIVASSGYNYLTPAPVPPSLLLLFPGLFGLAAARKRFWK